MVRIVPWYSRDEWLETYKNLYDFDNIEQQLKGIERVEAWKSRSGNKLPLSIEVTASLIAAGIEDIESRASPYVVRQVMGMAVVRFVNSMVDLEQKGLYARSVQSIADEIGLPDWLVDLRHEATHAGLPSLEVLRAGCKFALDWLQRCYWESQVAEFQERDEMLVQLLRKYVKHYGYHRSGEKTKKTKNKKVVGEIVGLVEKSNMWKKLLDLSFGEQQFLVPSCEILQETFPSNEMTEISLELPKGLHQSLGPLLKALQKTNNKFFSTLVSFLVQRIHHLEMTSKNVLLVRYLSCLVHFILFNCSNKNEGERQWKIKADMDNVSLLEIFLNNPSTYSSHLLPLVIENLELSSEHLKDKLHKLSTINISFNKEERLDENTVIDCLGKEYPLVANQMKLRQTQLDEDGSSVSVWQKCDVSFTTRFEFGAFLCKELLQEEDLNDNEALMDVDTNIDVAIPREQNWNEVIELESCDSYDSLEEISEMSCFSQATDTSVMPTELTKKMVEDISKKVWIF